MVDVQQVPEAVQVIKDYWTALSKRVITQTSDSAGGFTETTADTTFYGRVCELTGSEVLRNKQLGNDATAMLLTETDLNLQDRVVTGAIEYEVVWAFTDFYKRYLLRRLK